MKNQPGSKVAGADGQMAGWRAALSRAFRTRPAYQVSHPQDKMANLALDEGQLNELRGLVEHLKRPAAFIGANPGAVLICGEAGTGKSMVARALAGEAGVPLISLRLASIRAQDLSRLVQQAHAVAPIVVLVEALDEGYRPESTAWNDAAQTATLLLQMAVIPRVLLLGTARRVDQVDPNLLGPGGFERQIILDLPDRRARLKILAEHTRGIKLTKDVNLGMIARATTGFSGSDLALLCLQAAEYSAQRGSRETSMSDFEQAVDQALLTCANKTIVNEQTRRILAYHEAGHALAAWITPAIEPILRVSLLHRWQIGFRPQAMPGYEQVGFSKEYLLALLSVLLAGRAGEEIGIGEITTGAENDLVEATALAHRMVSRWGMGRLGPISFDQLANKEPGSTGEPCYSETTAARIDQDVQELLKNQYQVVSQQLKVAQAALERLAETLLDDETVDLKEIARIYGPRPLHGNGENDLHGDVSEVHQPSKIR